MMFLFIRIGAISAMLSVVLGAMAAHALKAVLDTYSLDIFHTASSYQMVHSIALILVALALPHATKPHLLRKSGWFFIAGIILFSGSLYVLSLSGIKQFGMITPIGGVLFILAWILFALSFSADNVDDGQKSNMRAD